MRGVDQLNEAADEEAFSAFLQCCGSVKWARSMVAKRPFQDIHELSVTADHEWWSLGEEDWLEAFSAHPKIGEKKTAATSESDRWASEEQSGASQAAIETLDALREANQDYERRFGYIFIVCATGKSADEMLALLKARIVNEPDTELRIAAEEQRRITNIRLNKLLSEVE
jgi:OHCU decarboxylase